MTNKITLLFLLFTVACRPDPGTPDYSSFAGITDSGVSNGENNEELPGPRPFEPGDKRLSFGVFYEGSYSDLLEVDEMTRHYYIFQTETDPPVLTYDQEESGDRIEGRVSDVITLSGTPWFGGGIIWDLAEDLSAWTTLVVAARSDSSALDDFDISVQYEIAGSLTAKSAKVSASTYGYTNDGEWHVLEIPLQDFIDQGAQLGAIRSPFIFAKDGGNAGDQLALDSLFLE